MGAINKGQSRDTGNIGHTRQRTKTIQRHWQHWAHKTVNEDNPETLTTLGTQDRERRQSRDTDNIGHTRQRTKTIQRHWQHWAHKTENEDNPETLTTLGTQDRERRQTKHKYRTKHRKLKRWATRTRQKPGWTQVLAKGRQFLPPIYLTMDAIIQKLWFQVRLLIKSYY
jgi:hypothetical protein